MGIGSFKLLYLLKVYKHNLGSKSECGHSYIIFWLLYVLSDTILNLKAIINHPDRSNYFYWNIWSFKHFK